MSRFVTPLLGAVVGASTGACATTGYHHVGDVRIGYLPGTVGVLIAGR